MPTPAERSRRGKDLRKVVPLESHAHVEVGADRDAAAILAAQDVSRVPELVPIRYGRMLVSPFSFFRGGAAVMAADLARTPVSGLRAQVCGDAHLSNFGLFASVERRLVFDLNDFDETLPGPWEWDVKRLVASLAIAARENGFSAKQRRRVILSAGSSYRTAMRDFAGQTNLAVWYAKLDVEDVLDRLRAQLAETQVRRTEATLAKARTRDSHRALRKLTENVKGELRIRSTPPLVVPVEELEPGEPADRIYRQMQTLLRGYTRSLASNRQHLLSQYRFVHLARKVVGVGSVGTRAWVVLLVGRDDGDPLFLQAKEAQASVLEAHVEHTGRAGHGRRVVDGQRLMQTSSDIFLGYQRAHGFDGKDRDFYVRQLLDWKGSAVVEVMVPQGMAFYASVCGWTLARAHARSGDRVAIAGYLGSSNRFEEALADFAEAYADVNDTDYAQVAKAAQEGRIAVETGT